MELSKPETKKPGATSKEKVMQQRSLTDEREAYNALSLGAVESEFIPLEDGREGKSAIVAGYHLEYSRTRDDEGKPTAHGWDWMVRLTADRSETPEVIDSGHFKSGSERGALRACSTIAQKHQRTVIEAARKAEAKKQTKPLKATQKKQSDNAPAKGTPSARRKQRQTAATEVAA